MKWNCDLTWSPSRSVRTHRWRRKPSKYNSASSPPKLAGYERDAYPLPASLRPVNNCLIDINKTSYTSYLSRVITSKKRTVSISVIRDLVTDLCHGGRIRQRLPEILKSRIVLYRTSGRLLLNIHKSSETSTFKPGALISMPYKKPKGDRGIPWPESVIRLTSKIPKSGRMIIIPRWIPMERHFAETQSVEWSYGDKSYGFERTLFESLDFRDFIILDLHFRQRYYSVLIIGRTLSFRIVIQPKVIDSESLNFYTWSHRVIILRFACEK